MGCGGSKDKAPEDEAPVPAKKEAPKKEAPKPAEPPKPAAPKPKEDKSLSWLSDDLRNLMADYFNRYDLDGSQTINSSDELKQLCTNLVVKLDLALDVSDIDKVVKLAGAFADDADATDGNNWNLETFVAWFCEPGHFNVDKDWTVGDESEEDEVPSAEKPFLNGTYIGVVEGADGKKWTGKYLKGATPKDGKLEGGELVSHHEFKFKVRLDEVVDGKTTIKKRAGCDSIGYFTSSGSISGTIQVTVAYDVDGDEKTKEPTLVFEGNWGGADAPNDIVGTWKNTEPEAAAKMADLGLDGCQEGTFKLSKRIRPDE